MANSKRTVILSIVLCAWTFWLTLLGHKDAISHLVGHWEVALTMSFGSLIAGGTSVGGGAVAFPVFTKILKISPHDAKLFSLAIQAVGMSAASLAIWISRIRLEGRVIFWGSLGGSLGIFLGLGVIAPFLPPDVIKMSFSIILCSFAVTLLALNRRETQRRYITISVWGPREKFIFFIAGLIGGLLSGCIGNGIDILTFSVMVLLFRVSEKVATPTSVVLMAINALVGLLLQVIVFHDLPLPVQEYWLAAIPVVVVGAPLGAMLCSLLHRDTIANFLIALIGIEVLTSVLLIPLRPIVLYGSLLTLILFSCLNYWFYRTQLYTCPQPSVD